MSKEKLGLGFLKSLVGGNLGGILLYLTLFIFVILYHIGKWAATLWFSLARKRIEQGKVQAFEQLWSLFALCFSVTFALSYMVFGGLLLRLDPYADWGTVFGWLAGIYALLILLKVVGDTRTYWQESPPYIPITQGEGVVLAAGAEDQTPNDSWLQGLFPANNQSRVAPPEVEEDDEDWEDAFFNF
jgi:hypothetical protein